MHLSPRRWLPTLLGGALVASLTCGCASTKEYFSYAHKDDVPGDACQVVATWQNHVVTTTDTQHNGAPLKGIAGRVYLFGSEINYPMLGEGSVVVDLYDETQPHQAGAPVMPLEEWRIDKDTLKRLHKKDVIGEGYTIFLPWATYKPEIARIQLKVRYEPVKGAPLYAASSPLTLTADDLDNKAGTVLPASHKINQPASGR